MKGPHLLVYGVAVSHFEDLAVANVQLMLADAVLPLAVLYRHA